MYFETEFVFLVNSFDFRFRRRWSNEFSESTSLVLMSDTVSRSTDAADKLNLECIIPWETLRVLLTSPLSNNKLKRCDIESLMMFSSVFRWLCDRSHSPWGWIIFKIKYFRNNRSGKCEESVTFVQNIRGINLWRSEKFTKVLKFLSKFRNQIDHKSSLHPKKWEKRVREKNLKI
jgi:hypothetical protein